MPNKEIDKDVVTLPNRVDIPKEKTWDLTKLYKDDVAWEADFNKIDALLEEFLAYKGKLHENAAILAEAFQKGDELDRLTEKIYVYAHLKSDEDTANSEYQGMMDRISAKDSDIEGEIAWFDPEILALSEERFKEYLESDELAFYKRTLEEMERFRKHTLTAPEERILGMASEVFSAPSKTFSMLNNADIKFPEISDEKGQKVELTHGNYIKFLENSDRSVRKAAFEGMYDTFKKMRNTLASTLDGNIKVHVLNAKLRNYDSALQASLHSDNVDVSIYNNLIKTIKDNIGVLHGYYGLRAKTLKLDKIDMYDVYNPLVPDYKVELSWEDACKWVEEAVQPMGKEYCDTFKRAFNERWIDVLECRGKRSGAYSSGCYDSYPYILMNFNGTLNSVFTLAHELGHSMHSHYSHTHQEYHYADYRIFVAEVASTTNEILLYHYLMKKADDEKFKAYLINHHIDDIRGTVFRQTMFADFEKYVHEQSESNIPLTADALCEAYYKLNAEYHGDAVDPNQKIEMEWARIPHFYYNFYVYKYATGLSAAISLSKGILAGDQNKLDAYMGFLKAGDSKDVLDIMKDAGVDLSTPQPIIDTVKEFDKSVKELDALL